MKNRSPVETSFHFEARSPLSLSDRWFRRRGLANITHCFDTLGVCLRGTIVAAWRNCLDTDGNGKLTYVFLFIYCRRKELMASVRQPREKLCASAFHPFKIQKMAPKVGGVTRSRTVFLEVFARWPIILSFTIPDQWTTGRARQKRRLKRRSKFQRQ